MNPPTRLPARHVTNYLKLVAVAGPVVIAAHLHWYLALLQHPLAQACSFQQTVGIASLSSLAVVFGISMREVTILSTIPVRLANLALLAAGVLASGLASWVAFLGLFWDLAWILIIDYRKWASSQPNLGEMSPEK